MPGQGPRPTAVGLVVQLSPALRYTIAIVAPAIALGLRLSLDPLWGPKYPLILFYPAVLISAWFGGFAPGVLATLLSALVAELFWMSPASSRALDSAGNLLALMVFVAVGLVMSALNEAWRRADVSLRQSETRLADLHAAERKARVQAEAAEERLRMALQAGGMGTWQWTIRTGDVIWSPGLEIIHGLSPGTFPGTFDAFQRDVHPDDRARVVEAIRHAIDERRDHQIEYRIVRPDGSVRWVEGRGQLFCDAQGQPERMVGVCSDITDRKGAAAELQAAIDARDDFISVASHELRNPVNAVQLQLTGVLRALERDETMRPASLADRIRQATVQVGRLTRLLDNLLDVSRLSVGSIVLEPEDLDLREVVDGVIAQFRHELAGRAVTLRAVQPAVGRWDRLRIEQVVTNLLSNAVKYGNGSPIDISLDVDGDRAHLSVTDRGIGIDEDRQQRLFTRFERAVTGRQYRGFGLGLWITRQLVEAMHGQIAVQSRPGQGATFFVALPRGASTGQSPPLPV